MAGSAGCIGSAPQQSWAAENKELGWSGGAQRGCSVSAGSLLTEGTQQQQDLTFTLFPPCNEGVSLQCGPNPGYSLSMTESPFAGLCYCCTSSMHCFHSFNLKCMNARYTKVLCKMAGEMQRI